MSRCCLSWHRRWRSAAFDGIGGIARLGAMPPPAPSWAMPLVVLPRLLMAGALSFVLIERPFLLLRRGPAH